MAYGIFPDQGLDLCLLHWQVDSYPLYHQGSPPFNLYLFICGCAEFLLLWLFSSCGEQGLLSSCSVGASHGRGFSCCRARAQKLWPTGLAALWHMESSQTRD